MQKALFQVVAMLFALAGLLFGIWIFKNARSAVHEIEALICFVISVIGFGSLAVSSAVEDLIQRTTTEARQQRQHAPPRVDQREQRQ